MDRCIHSDGFRHYVRATGQYKCEDCGQAKPNPSGNLTCVCCGLTFTPGVEQVLKFLSHNAAICYACERS